MNTALTDLEEQILFMLEIQETHMSIHQLIEHVTTDAGKSITMASMHKTVWKLVAEQFVTRTLINQKWMYGISVSGSMVLHEEWRESALQNIERL
jgi:S-adenosylmethionine synthetase